MTEDHDPYVWMEKLEDPKVVKWFSKRDAATRKLLSPISRKLESRIKKYFAIPYVLMVRTRPNGHFVLLRDSRTFKLNLLHQKGDITELVNSAELGKDAVIQGFYASGEGDLFAFVYSLGGSDEGILKVMKTGSKETLDEMKGMFGDVVWLNQEKYLFAKFYQKDKTPDGVAPPAMRIHLRENGADELVFGRGIATSYFISLKKSLESSRAMVTVADGWTKSDVYVGKLRQPEGWSLVYGEGDFITWPIDYVHGKCYTASFDKKGMGRILALGDNGEIDEIVGEQPYPLQEAVVANERIAATYLFDATSILRIYELSGRKHNELKPEPAGTIGSLDSDGKKCTFTYQSFLVPYRIYCLEEDALTVVDSKEVRGAFEVRDLWVKSKDSTRIHVFDVGKKGRTANSVLAWGYGGFAVSITPSYFSYIIPFLESGGTFAVASLRGGTEYGEAWHREGMRENKQNVFDDFMSVLKYYRNKGSKTVGFGVSNGGLLIGAVLTQRPDLIDGALIGYPVLDMLRYHKLHIGKAWMSEYGDPDNPKDRKFLTKYSPYHNVTRRSYPKTMIYTGTHDDRVHPAHAFKFAARLEEEGAYPLLRVETRSGHSGATPARKIREYSDMMAFVYETLAMQP
jgi:prolyl oligopeptidase